jgi:DNA-binding response OmpR family regulator
MNALKILVIEDEPLIAMLLCDLLIMLGHTICGCAATEQAAITAAMQDRPELMIVDVNLREGSGIAAAAQIARSGFVPHVFVTGAPYELVGLNPDAIVVQKPFTAAELTRAIQRAVPGCAMKADRTNL